MEYDCRKEQNAEGYGIALINISKSFVYFVEMHTTVSSLAITRGQQNSLMAQVDVRYAISYLRAGEHG
jgi:hypothetical protein